MQALASAGATDVAAGGSTMLMVLLTSGAVAVWGPNATAVAVPTPAQSGVRAIAAGHSHCVALRNDGTVVAWGSNAANQTAVPDGLSDVVAVTAGANHSLALQSTGRVVAWGTSEFGLNVVPSDALANVVLMGAGQSHSITVTAVRTATAVAGALSPSNSDAGRECGEWWRCSRGRHVLTRPCACTAVAHAASPPPPEEGGSSMAKVPIIVGAAVGGAVALVALLALVVFVRRRASPSSRTGRDKDAGGKRASCGSPGLPSWSELWLIAVAAGCWRAGGGDTGPPGAAARGGGQDLRQLKKVPDGLNIAGLVKEVRERSLPFASRLHKSVPGGLDTLRAGVRGPRQDPFVRTVAPLFTWTNVLPGPETVAVEDGVNAAQLDQLGQAARSDAAPGAAAESDDEDQSDAAGLASGSQAPSAWSSRAASRATSRNGGPALSRSSSKSKSMGAPTPRARSRNGAAGDDQWQCPVVELTKARVTQELELLQGGLLGRGEATTVCACAHPPHASSCPPLVGCASASCPARARVCRRHGHGLRVPLALALRSQRPAGGQGAARPVRGARRRGDAVLLLRGAHAADAQVRRSL